MTSLKKISLSDMHIAFLGCGSICVRHVKQLRKLHPHIKLSFASMGSGKSATYREKYQGIKSFNSYEEAIEDSNINVIFITTPPHNHYELCKSALEHGKHVIVEKPPFITAAELEEMGNLANANGLQLMIAENYFYKPLRYAIKKLIESEVIGKPVFVNIVAVKKQASKNDWRDDENITHFGALYEGGIHWINFINNLGLDITTINGFTRDKNEKLEKSVLVNAHTSQGAMINLLYSWEINSLLKGIRLSKIYGTEGSITFESNGIFIFVRGKKTRVNFPQLSKITGGVLMLTDFVQAIANGTPPEFNWHLAYKDMVSIEKVYNYIKTT
jgi:UDP-N-acetylglucosamine 3-dehydrogenase